MIMSVDGYVEDAEGRFDWGRQWRAADKIVYSRTLTQTPNAVPAALSLPGVPPTTPPRQRVPAHPGEFRPRTVSGMELSDRPGLVMAGIGTVSVVAGGLVAAVTSPLQLAHGSWLAAYLVLVAGVGQCAMAAVRLLATTVGDSVRGWLQTAAWNLGNLLVMGGTFMSSPWMVDAGGLLCVVGIALALLHSRLVRDGRLVWAYRIVLAVMLVSVPIGLVVSQLRHG